jgi:hypothetical protein
MNLPGDVQPDPIDRMHRFVDAADELAKNPTLLGEEGRKSAKGVLEICRMILTSNERIARWRSRFLDFDFEQVGAEAEFDKIVAKYNEVKNGNGPELRLLKWKCGEIWPIYESEIQPVVSRRKRGETDAAFDFMATADPGMIRFIDDDVIDPLDEFVKEAKGYIGAHNIDAAERSRLQYKAELGELSAQLEMINGQLAGLVNRYRAIAGV